MGDDDKAMIEYAEAIPSAPNSAFAYEVRGAAYAAGGEFDKAVADFTESLRIDPKDADAGAMLLARGSTGSRAT